MSKVLNSDAQRFSSECEEKWAAMESEGKTGPGRSAFPAEGPGSALALDRLIQCEIDRLCEAQKHDEVLLDAVVDRATMTEKCFGLT